MSETTTTAGPGTPDRESLARAARSIRHPLARALLVLTFTTGLVDAVSFLGLGRVFTANMTGNIIFLGFGIAGSGGLPVLAPLISLASFLLGAGAGGVLAERIGHRHREHVARALAIEVSLLAVAARPGGGGRRSPERCLGRRRDRAAGVRDGRPERDRPARRRARPDDDRAHDDADRARCGLATGRGLREGLGATVLAMLSGGLAGALLLKTNLVLPLIAAAGLALVTWLVYIPAARRGADSA
jgi:hypothetical protein